MKIAVSVYSFDRYPGSGEMSLARAVEASAELGFAGFEMLPWYFADKRGSPQEARELRKVLADSGLDLCCYTLANDFGLPDGPSRQAVIDDVRREIDIPVRACLEALKTRGYAGWLSVEHESAEDPMTGLVRSRANLQEMVSSLS
jgi:sugar phosphate isomerase/epimerase